MGAIRSVPGILLLALSLAVLGAAAPAAAMDVDGCALQLDAVMRSAYPEAMPDDRNGWLLAGAEPRWLQAVCKVWPMRPEWTLVAVTVRDPVSEDWNGRADLDVLVASSDAAEILHRHRENGVLSGDAIRLNGVSLDTAPYVLADGVDAFGVRIDRVGSSHANPLEIESLRLYEVDDRGMRLVLRNLSVKSYGGEWDTRCNGEFSDLKRTVAVLSTRHRGRADLRVDTVDIDSVALSDGDDCNETRRSINRSTVRLAFDGEHYVVPRALLGWDDGYADGSRGR